MSEKPLTKTKLLAALADETGLSKQAVGSVLDSLEGIIEQQISSNDSPGSIAIQGLFKIERKIRPALPERSGRNPSTGETITLKPRPESVIVKVKPLKKLKEMVV